MATLIQGPKAEVLANIARAQLLRVRQRRPATHRRFNAIRGVNQLWALRTSRREAALYRWSR